MTHLRSFIALLVFAFATVALVGCRGLDLKNGAKPCGGAGTVCPSGFECQADKHCWRPHTFGAAGQGGGGGGGAGGSNHADAGSDATADGPGSGGSAGTSDDAGFDVSDPSDGALNVVVTIVRTGNGSITGPGISCTDASCQVMVRQGSDLVLTAVPAGDSNFSAWSGCSSTSSATCTLTGVAGAKQVTASFAPKTSNLVIAKDGSGTGTVSATWVGGGAISCGANCAASVPKGTIVTLTATPDPGSTVTWVSPTCGAAGPCVLTIGDALSSVKATFTLSKVTLTIARSGNGTVTGTGGVNCLTTSCAVSLSYGDSITLMGAPAPDSDAPTWTGCTPSAPNSCVVSTLKADQSVSASFPLKKVQVSIARSGNGTITSADGQVNCSMASCTAMVSSGSSLVLTANPGADSDFMGWSGGCTTMTGSTCTISGIKTPQSVAASFRLKDSSFSVSKSGNGAGTVTGAWTGGSLSCGNTCSAGIQPGTQVTLTATPATGSTFAWGTPCSGTGTCVVNVGAVTSVSVTFTLLKYTVNVAPSGPAGAGSVNSQNANVDLLCGATCSAKVDYGTSLQLVAQPGGGGSFKSWTSCPGTASGNTCTFTVSQATTASTITAAFQWGNGKGCAGAGDCSSGNCIGSVCCNTACNGPCDNSCVSGICTAKATGTLCETVNGLGGASLDTDILKTCDSSRACLPPTIKCPNSRFNPTLTTDCNLASKACCIINDNYDVQCVAPTTCYPVDQGDLFSGYNCLHQTDCPTNYVCCSQTITELGAVWSTCTQSCTLAYQNGHILP